MTPTPRLFDPRNCYQVLASAPLASWAYWRFRTNRELQFSMGLDRWLEITQPGGWPGELCHSSIELARKE